MGLAKIRMFSPFPGPEIVEALGNVKAIVTLDRFEGAPIYRNLCSTFYSQETRPILFGRITGVGGIHPSIEDIIGIGERVLEASRGAAIEPEVAWLLKATKKYSGQYPQPG